MIHAHAREMVKAAFPVELKDAAATIGRNRRSVARPAQKQIQTFLHIRSRQFMAHFSATTGMVSQIIFRGTRKTPAFRRGKHGRTGRNKTSLEIVSGLIYYSPVFSDPRRYPGGIPI
jgi:hypothetical protein